MLTVNCKNATTVSYSAVKFPGKSMMSMFRITYILVPTSYRSGKTLKSLKMLRER